MAAQALLEHGEFREAGLVPPRLAGLALERADLAFDLANDVGEADEIGLGVLELAERLLFLALVFRDAGGFLEDGAAVLRARGKDEIDLALLHDGVGGAADAGVHEELVDVAQAAGRLVELVLAGAVAEDAARDGDLVVLDPEVLLAIAEGERDFGHAERGARVGAGEDDVLHFTAAERLGRLLAEDPADAVEDVAFATAVRPHDGGDAGVEFQRGAVGKGLESDDVERLQVHVVLYTRRFTRRKEIPPQVVFL
jgi:hypothetical protein